VQTAASSHLDAELFSSWPTVAAMPFPGRLLHDGEQVVIDVRPHWWYLVGPVVVFAAVIAGALAVAVDALPSAADWTAIAALVLAGVWLVGRYVRWASTSLVVTTTRLIRRTGVVSRSGREVPLAALTDITYHQRLGQRLIGAGDLLLESAGRDGQEVFPDLPRPAWIQQVIATLVDQIRRPFSSPGGESGGSSTWSIPAQIQELDGLRRRGLITDAEFQAKKTQLLDRL
jgi:membrane protein YdbS with pleckstrin-like domain